MKQTKRIISLTALFLTFVMLIGLMSCGMGDISSYIDDDPPATIEGEILPSEGTAGAPPSSGNGDTDIYIIDIAIRDGSFIATMSDGTEKNIGAAVTNVTENNVTINNTTTEGTAQSVSKALLSTVAVRSGFTVSQYVSSGGFYGGYRDVISYASGSGVIYTLDKASGDAYIITNYHVIYHASSKDPGHISQKISVYMIGDNEETEATFIGGSPVYDIAVLKVSGSTRLAKSAAAAVEFSPREAVAGEGTLVVGNAKGYGISVTGGVVSVDSEYIEMNSILDDSTQVSSRVLRTDAPVNPGNSGGGLYDTSGRLLGIVNAKIVNEDTEGLGYAIPADIAKTIADKAIAGDMNEKLYTRRVLLGVTLTTADSSMVYDTETGLVSIRETVVIVADAPATSTTEEVVGVTVGGLGDLAGLKSGDIFVSIKVGESETRLVTRQYHVIDEVLKAAPGDTITITVMRDVDGTMTEVTCTVTVPLDYYEN